MPIDNIRNDIETGEAYRAATTSAVVFHRSDRAFVRVYGRDPVKMVQGLITNDLALASDRRAVYAGLLTPKGKLVAELRVYLRGNDVLLETDAGALDNLLAHFRKFVPPLFARFEVTDAVAMLGVYGPTSPAIVAQLFDSALPVAEDEMVAGDGIAAIRTHYAGDPGFDLLIDGDITSIRDRLGEAGAQPADLATLDPLRIEAGSPRWGTELDESVIPLEAGLRTRMISESKGCYTGQEIIIRILHRGHVNRLLRGMLLGDQPPAAKGTELFNPVDHKPVGRITSSCVSPRFGQTIALGYARRELTLPASLHLGTVNGPLVTVVELPFKESEADHEADSH
ncbi:MAG: YgfZ/GcvT domain-containing protein [Longimicrobiales bacterium]